MLTWSCRSTPRLARERSGACVRAVQRLDHFAVHAAGGQPELAPDLLPFGRGPLHVDDVAALLAEGGQGGHPHVVGDLFNGPAFGGHVQVAGDAQELLGILDLVALRLAPGDRLQGEGQVTPMVRVS